MRQLIYYICQYVCMWIGMHKLQILAVGLVVGSVLLFKRIPGKQTKFMAIWASVMAVSALMTWVMHSFRLIPASSESLFYVIETAYAVGMIGFCLSFIRFAVEAAAPDDKPLVIGGTK